jgi:tripartite-type tricarboxylate transporter receptor subunit TctC
MMFTGMTATREARFDTVRPSDDGPHVTTKFRQRLRRLCGSALCLLVALAAVSFSHQSLADDYPNRRVRVIIPYTPGGTPDVLFRMVGQALSSKWGQPVVIENRPGGNTFIGTSALVNSPADGYTLMLTADNTFIINPLFYKSMPYQMSDLAPITLVASAPHMLAITKNAPAKSVQDFIAWAKSKPDTIMYGTTGPAGLQRLSMELFSRIAGIKLMQVPYKGAPEAITAVLTGEVTASINSVASLLPHVAAGNMRTLGVASIKRVALAPDIPTIQEQGVPGFSSQGSFGLFGPAALPDAIRDKIQADVAAVLTQPEIRAYLVKRGFEPVGNSAAEFRAFIASETEKWKRVISDANIKAD